jgi:hypothetical protein
MTLHFDPITHICITGRNPEMADINNPCGEIYGFSATVRASNERGEAWEYFIGTFANESAALQRAQKLASALTARIQTMGKPPVGFDRWIAARPLYGSDAYIEHGAADDLAWEQTQHD